MPVHDCMSMTNTNITGVLGLGCDKFLTHEAVMHA